MTFDALRYFVAVAEYHSIIKAAEILHISQSAVSRNLQRLEEELGVRLFERGQGKSGSRLTEAGEACYAEAVETLKHGQRMLSILSDYGKGIAGGLTIGFSGYEGAWFIPWLGSVEAAFPGIRVLHTQGNWGELIEGVQQGTIDLAVIGTLMSDSADENIDMLFISEISMKVVVPRHHALAGRKSVRLKELEGIPYISYARSMNDGHDYFEELCRHQGIELHRVAEYDNTVMICSAVIANNGFSVSSTGMTSSDELVYLDIEDAEEGAVTGSLSFIYRRDSESRCLKTVVHYTKQYLKALNLK